MQNEHPPVLIFTITKRPAVIAGFGFLPNRAFSVYALYEEFMRDVAEQDQTDENFFHWLLEQGYGDYIEPEQIPEQATRFLSWELRPTAMDFGAAFDIVHKFPSVMTQHLLEQLASGWRTEIFQQAMFTREDYFRFLKEKMDSPQAVEDLRMTVVKSTMKAQENGWIAERGYAINSFFSTTEGVNFAYTVGLTARAGLEVISLAHLDLGILAGVVTKVADSYITELPHITPGIYEGWMASTDGKQLRFQVNDVAISPVLTEYILNTRGTVRRVLQVLIADKNNILPTEPGYDTEGFPQPVLEVN